MADSKEGKQGAAFGPEPQLLPHCPGESQQLCSRAAPLLLTGAPR